MNEMKIMKVKDAGFCYIPEQRQGYPYLTLEGDDGDTKNILLRGPYNIPNLLKVFDFDVYEGQYRNKIISLNVVIGKTCKVVAKNYELYNLHDEQIVYHY